MRHLRPQRLVQSSLGIKNMTEAGHLDLSQIRHISESDYVAWTRRVEPRPGDIVFTYEASLHRYAVLPEGFRGCLGRRVALLRPDPRVAETKFFFCTRSLGRNGAGLFRRGSTSGRRSTACHSSTFPTSRSAYLRSIASARLRRLSAYDDLIKNNRRRIELLEEMAQRFYREWFVEFRYPGTRRCPYGLGGRSISRRDGNWPRSASRCVNRSSWRQPDVDVHGPGSTPTEKAAVHGLRRFRPYRASQREEHERGKYLQRWITVETSIRRLTLGRAPRSLAAPCVYDASDHRPYSVLRWTWTSHHAVR